MSAVRGDDRGGWRQFGDLAADLGQPQRDFHDNRATANGKYNRAVFGLEFQIDLPERA